MLANYFKYLNIILLKHSNLILYIDLIFLTRSDWEVMNGVIWWEKLEWMYGNTLLKSLNVINKHLNLFYMAGIIML